MEKIEVPHAQAARSKVENVGSVLVIDDTEEMLILQRAILELDGYKVYTALSGSAGLEMLTRMESPSLILLDVQMEGMNGLEFMAKLDELMPEVVNSVPVVFITGLENVPLGKASGRIRKPMDTDEFLATVRHFIAGGSACAPYKH